ncbi:MAG: hypothetical protein IKX55_00345 [Bacteroidaceae bacterium]|nr:hypothetical protein [Bacteroidaceae bacterium]
MERVIIRLLCCLTVIPAILSSCNDGNKSQQGIIGKKLDSDSLLLFRNREYTLVNDTVFKDVTVLLWIDSTKCSQCELEHLGNYEAFSSHCEKIMGKECSLKVVISLSELYGIGYLINDVKYLNHSFDVMIDYKNRFTSLFECNDRLLLVLKEGRVLKYYSMENTEGDAYRMQDCLDYLKQLYVEEQKKNHDKIQ